MRDRPYRGLMPFSERQAPFFFGRDAERKIVTANLLASRLTVLYGPSGVGKSSLLNAGVACHLRRVAQQNLQEFGTPEFSVIVFGAWRDDPRCGLARVLSQQISEDIPGRLAERLDRVSSRLNCDLLVILDQFEEYFLYHPHEDGQGGFASGVRGSGQSERSDKLSHFDSRGFPRQARSLRRPHPWHPGEPPESRPPQPPCGSRGDPEAARRIQPLTIAR